MKRMALLCVLLLFSCTPAPTKSFDAKSVKLQDNFQLQQGQTASVESEKLSFTPVAVTQDSRCPKNVQCIQAGEVDVDLKINLKGATATKNISSMYIKPLLYENFVIRLLQVSPDREKPSQTIEPSDYVFTFRISKEEPAALKPVPIEKPNFSGVIFPPGTTGTQGYLHQERWLPGEQDILQVENFLPKCIENELKRREDLVAQDKGFFYPQEEENLKFIVKNLADYKRQYFGIVNEYSGEHSISINFLYKDVLNSSDPPNWKEEMVSVKGGGRDYFQIDVHPSRETCANLMINSPK